MAVGVSDHAEEGETDAEELSGGVSERGHAVLPTVHDGEPEWIVGGYRLRDVAGSSVTLGKAIPTGGSSLFG